FRIISSIAKSGLHFKIPIVDGISTKLSLKIKHLNVSVETKTKDNVFVNLVVVVQYRVLPDKVYEACYMLHDPEQQIKAFIFDLVRAQVPLLNLDDVFSKKDDIAITVKGIAGQRQAIIEGLSDSVEEFVKQIPGIDPSRVMDMVMMIQYIDTLKEIGGNSKSNVVFVPHSPGNVNDLSNQIRETIFSAQKLN
ncbi:hypothetical protein U3516DRAFT_885548, partial [Neocallimastix sp. 'constans']